MAIDVRACDPDDLDVLLAGAGPRDQAHHRERWGQQLAGEATYLIAWDGADPVGRATLLHRSKYDNVRADAGSFPEINALEATTPGRGVGSAILAAAEAVARNRGASAIGLGVADENPDARRLYERLGYEPWDGGAVVDEWIEMDPDGVALEEHADTCEYLIKPLEADA